MVERGGSQRTSVSINWPNNSELSLFTPTKSWCDVKRKRICFINIVRYFNACFFSLIDVINYCIKHQLQTKQSVWLEVASDGCGLID